MQRYINEYFDEEDEDDDENNYNIDGTNYTINYINGSLYKTEINNRILTSKDISCLYFFDNGNTIFMVTTKPDKNHILPLLADKFSDNIIEENTIYILLPGIYEVLPHL